MLCVVLIIYQISTVQCNITYRTLCGAWSSLQSMKNILADVCISLWQLSMCSENVSNNSQIYDGHVYCNTTKLYVCGLPLLSKYHFNVCWWQYSRVVAVSVILKLDVRCKCEGSVLPVASTEYLLLYVFLVLFINSFSSSRMCKF